jgi:hypothetical protein
MDIQLNIEIFVSIEAEYFSYKKIFVLKIGIIFCKFHGSDGISEYLCRNKLYSVVNNFYCLKLFRLVNILWYFREILSII